MANNTIVVNVLGNVRGLQRSLTQASHSLGGLDRIGQNLGGTLKIAGIAFAGMGAAAVGAAAVGAGALLAVTAGVAGLGIAVAAQNEKVKSAFSDMSEHVMAQMTKITAPFVPVLVAGAGHVQRAFDVIAPSLSNIFKAAAPLLNDLFKQLVPLAKQLGPVLEQAFSAGVPVLRAFMSGLTPVVAGIGGFFKELENPAFANFITAFMTAIGQLLPSIGRLFAALAPLGTQLMPMIVAAFNALVDVLIAYVIPAFTKAFDFIDKNRELFGAIAVAIGVGIVAFKAVGLVMAVIAAGPVVAIMAALALLAYVFKDDLIPVVKDVLNWFKQMWDKHGPAVADALDKIRSAAEDMWQRIKPVISQMVDTFKAAFEFIGVAVQKFVEFVMRLWNAWGDSILSAVKTTWNGILRTLEGVFQVIEGIFKVFTGILTGDWNKAWSGIKDIVAGAWKVITGLIQTAWGNIKTVITTTMAVVTTIISTQFNAIKGFIAGILPAIGGAIAGAWNSIKTNASAAWTAIKVLVTAAWTSIKSSLVSGIATVVTTVKGFPGKIKTAMGNLGSLLYNAGKDIIRGLLNGIKSMAGAAANAAKDVANSVKNAVTGALGINSPSKVFREIGINVNEGLILGLERTAGIRKAASGLSKAVAAGFEAPQLGLTHTALTATTAQPAIVNVTVNAPVGSNPADIGRELDSYLASYYRRGGRRLS